jgi:hypothetical protein
MKYIEHLENLLFLLEDHSGLFTIVVVIFGGLWALVKFREHIKDKRFKTYHQLIDWLVNEQTHADRVIKLDRQIAVVYELRNFPKYFDVSIRILEGLLVEWKDNNTRIIEEIKLSLAYMKRSWLVRKFKK